MTWYENVFVLIDTRSFTSIWYWILLALMWSSASHFTLGVPFDLVTRARRRGGIDAQDAEILAHVQVRRRLTVIRTLGHWLIAVVTAVLTLLLVLGFGYGVELAQAVFLLLFPLSLTGLLSLRTAARIEAFDERGEALFARLARLRLVTQLVGMVSIFVTAMWGTWRIMTVSVLGG